MQNNDVTIRRKSYAAAKEIKASAHYAYVVNGITLDGSKFETGGFVEEGRLTYLVYTQNCKKVYFFTY